MGNLNNITNSIDDHIKNIVDSFVVSFLKNNNKIKSAYKSKTYLNELHYSIVLSEDNSETRNSIFDFYDIYSEVPFSNKYPVSLQIVPVELIGKININHQIIPADEKTH
jgi:hypothetical protein